MPASPPPGSARVIQSEGWNGKRPARRAPNVPAATVVINDA